LCFICCPRSHGTSCLSSSGAENDVHATGPYNRVGNFAESRVRVHAIVDSVVAAGDKINVVALMRLIYQVGLDTCIDGLADKTELENFHSLVSDAELGTDGSDAGLDSR
jgi:hypothetical protein